MRGTNGLLKNIRRFFNYIDNSGITSFPPTTLFGPGVTSHVGLKLVIEL